MIMMRKSHLKSNKKLLKINQLRICTIGYRKHLITMRMPKPFNPRKHKVYYNHIKIINLIESITKLREKQTAEK